MMIDKKNTNSSIELDNIDTSTDENAETLAESNTTLAESNKAVNNLCVLMCLMWFVIQNTLSPFQGWNFSIPKKIIPITNNLTTSSLTINH